MKFITQKKNYSKDFEQIKSANLTKGDTKGGRGLEAVEILQLRRIFYMYLLWSPMVLPGEPLLLHCTLILLIGRTNKSHEVVPSNCKGGSLVLKWCNFEEYSLWSPMVLPREPLVLHCTPMILIERNNKNHEVVHSNCKGGSLAPHCGYLSLHV